MTRPLEIEISEVVSLQANGEPFYFIDCREADEYETASIPGTTLFPMSELRDRLGELEPHRQSHIVVHCHHGGRSLAVARALRQAGFPDAQSMSGGIDAWSVEVDSNIPRY
jgi:rhodanese-related sulfurtransferase